LIGDVAYCTYLSGVIGPAILFIVGSVILLVISFRSVGKNTGDTDRNFRWRGIFLSVVWPCLTGSIFLSNLGNFQLITFHHSQLIDLSADNVTSIQIAGHTIQDKPLIISFVDALHEVEYFAVNHGGLAQAVSCEVRQRSGSKYCFTVSRYLRQEGAVLDFNNGNCSFFSSKLPNTLSQAGVELPAH